MSKRKLISVFAMAAMLLASLAVVFPFATADADNPVEETGTGIATPETFEFAEGAGNELAFPLTRIEPSLREIALIGSKDKTEVLIAATDPTELNRYLKQFKSTSIDGEEIEARGGLQAVARPNPAKIDTMTVEVPGYALMDIAGLDGVIGVFPPQRPSIVEYTEPEIAQRRNLMRQEVMKAGASGKGGTSTLDSGGGVSPMDWGIIHEHAATDAWAMGYTGVGTNIAVVDTGVDFAQPNLVGQWAVVEDPASPYFGWPIAWDPPSMDLLLDYWTSYIYPYPIYASYGESSWYSDTNYEATLANTPVTVNVDGDIGEWAGPIATDPLGDMLDTDYDLWDLYVGSGYDAATDQLGWFTGWSHDVSSAMINTTWVAYINLVDTDSASTTLVDNNIGVAGEVVIASTMWEYTAILAYPSAPNEEIIPGTVSLYLDDGTTFVENQDFTVNYLTGDVTFLRPLYPGYELSADYAYGLTDITFSDAFVSGNLVDLTLELNGVFWNTSGGLNWTADMAQGTVTFAGPLALGDIVTADYTFTAGAAFDPEGFGVTAVDLPEWAIVVRNTAIPVALAYEWTGKDWAGPLDLEADLGGVIGFTLADPILMTYGAVELFLPKSEGWFDPEYVNIELFSTGADATNPPQDTVPSDPNVPGGGTQWMTPLELSAMTTVDSAFLVYTMNGPWYTKRYNPNGYGGPANMDLIDSKYYIGNIATGADPVFHIGIAKDDLLTTFHQQRVGMLVVDSDDDGTYDTVYVDFDNDKNFADEKPTNKASPLAYADYYDAQTFVWDSTSWDTGDGLPDLTAGLLTFISDTTGTVTDEVLTWTFWGDGMASAQLANGNIAADIIGGYDPFPVTLSNASGDLPLTEIYGDFALDYNTGNLTVDLSVFNVTGQTIKANYSYGLPIPYSDVYSAENGYANFIPADGDFVVMFGDMDTGGFHGTQCASNAVGLPVGNIYYPAFGLGLDADAYGTAPGAKIIGIGNFYAGSGYDAWYFAAEGYDGIPGTGDEADVVSNSFGSASAAFGWDFVSRLAYDINTNYAPLTTFTVAASNEGPGYGTVRSPSTSPSVITVGGGITNNYRTDEAYSYDGGPIGNHTYMAWGPEVGPYGDIIEFSGRGPSALGQPKPDVIAVGGYAVGGIPTNAYANGYDAWTLWGGTSLASPVAAGLTALVYEAYRAGHAGATPDNQLVKSILMSTADDHKTDVLQQGAGWINALRAVQVALDTDGVYSDTPTWVPGGFGGVHRDAFVNLLNPGDSDTKTITLTNTGPAPVTADITDEVLARSGSISFDWIYGLEARKWITVFNGAGFYEALTGNPMTVDLQGQDLAALWNGADFLKIMVHPTEPGMIAAHDDVWDMYFEAFIWTDVSTDGVFDGFSEQNRVAWQVPGGNLAPAMVLVYDPATRTNDGIALSMRDGGSTTIEILYTTTIEFYEKSDWLWATTPASVNIPAGSTASFDLTITVPADAQAGSYQAGIYYDVGGVTSTIPVLVNVPVTTSPLNVGGGVPETSLYDVNGVSGAGGGQYGHQGDFRFFFSDTNLLEGDDSQKFIMGSNWQDTAADNELHLYTSTPDTTFTDDTTYGPYTLAQVAATKLIPGATDTTHMNKEFLKADEIPTQLFEFVVRNLNAMVPSEPFDAYAGIMTTTPVSAEISSDSLAGASPVQAWSNVDLIDGLGVAVTESITEFYDDMPVDPYPSPGGDFSVYLYNAPNVMTTVVPPQTIQAKWTMLFHSGASDVDMGIFLDADCDGSYGVGDEVDTAHSASTGNNPEVYAEVFPDPGCYMIHAAGFDVAPGSMYDLTFELSIIGAGIFGAGNMPTADVAPYTSTGFDITWDLPGSTSEGHVTSVLIVSPGYAPFSLTQPIAIDLRYDVTAPSVLSMSPSPGSTVNDPFYVINAAMQDIPTGDGDLVPNSQRLWLDGTDITHNCLISTPFDSDSDTPQVGYWLASIAHKPSQPLEDGWHSATVTATDRAGNTGSISWSFYVDTTAPSLEVTSPATDIVTSSSTIDITGITDSDATVTVQSLPVSVRDDGTFSYTLDLPTDINDIVVTATDPYENSASVYRRVIFDDTTPVLDVFIPPAPVTNEMMTTINGRFSEHVTLTVSGVEVAVSTDGSFEVAVPLDEGRNTIVMDAYDAAGNTFHKDDIVVTRDTVAPGLSIQILNADLDPETGQANKAIVNVTGTATDNYNIKILTVNGWPATPGLDGQFSKEVTLSFGSNEITVMAVDDAGNTVVQGLSITWLPERTLTRQTYTSLILMALAVVLLIIGLLIGLIVGRKPAFEEEIPEEEIPEEEIPEEEMPLEEPMEEALEEELVEEEALEEIELPEETPPAEEPPGEEPLEGIRPPEEGEP